jgi:type I restriction enzyme S subunit
LSIHKQTKQQLEKDIIRASRLRQSILKQAFSGKLVPQDPNDEPASILLQRIQAEKANTIKAQPAKRQPKRKVES